MKFIVVSLLAASLQWLPLYAAALDSNSSESIKQEVIREIERLERLKKEISTLMEENLKTLEAVKKEKEELIAERQKLEELTKKLSDERYVKLAKTFEKMDPELAGEKISKIEDAMDSAYILYNMKERYAGAVLNYVDAARVGEIVKILTNLKKQPHTAP